MKNQKGFTLIELLITLGLTGIIISIVMSFLIFNLKSYETISDDSELQFQTQYILNFMTNKILECKNIELVKENTVSHLKKTSEQNVTRISFRYVNDFSKCYNFVVMNDKIRYGNSKSTDLPNDELGIYIKNLYVTPLNGKSFEEAYVINLRIVLEKKNQRYEAEQTVYMRNYATE